MESKFERQLREWMEFELFVARKLREKGLFFIKNPEALWVDLLWNWDWEVKHDNQMRLTWNMYLEYQCSNLPSWILKYNCKYFIYWDELGFAVFDRLELLQYALWNWNIVPWWDWNKTKGILIEQKKVRHLILTKWVWQNKKGEIIWESIWETRES